MYVTDLDLLETIIKNVEGILTGTVTSVNKKERLPLSREFSGGPVHVSGKSHVVIFLQGPPVTFRQHRGEMRNPRWSKL